MIKLDDDLLKELGLVSLPPEEKKKLLAHIYETLEMRVGMKLAEQMSDAQLTEFEQFIDRNDEAGALHWLETNFPNYKDVVAAEFENLKAEIAQVAPQILSSAPAMQQPMPQMQAPQQPSMPPQSYTQAQPPQQPMWPGDQTPPSGYADPWAGQPQPQQQPQVPPQQGGYNPDWERNQQQQPPYPPQAYPPQQ